MSSPNLNPAHVMKDVYSYPFPEVRKLIDDTTLSQEFMINTLPLAEAGLHLESYGFEPPLSLTGNPLDGTLNLDALHEPVIDRIRGVVGQSLPGLDSFANAYPIPGSNQAIFNLMAEWKAIGKLSSIAVVEGEYDGYAANANTLRIPVSKFKSIDHANDTAPKNGEIWFTSNPSARDGNWLDKDTWKTFTSSGHQIVYDAAYVGLTQGGMVDVSPPNIQALLTSPSKIFGVFRNRYTGVTYTRDTVESMYSTKWFKSIPGLLDTLALYESFGNNELPRKYRPVQEEICRQLGVVVGAEVMPSDTLLLGHTTGRVGTAFESFARANGYRFGLTKLFEDTEKQKQS